MIEQYTMLSELQMRVRESCFSEIMLNLLINQIHAVWRKKNYVIFLLSLNITDIFDWIISSCLVHVLCMKKISEKLMKWMHIYMTDHITTLMLSDTKIEKSTVTAEIFQSSLLSLSIQEIQHTSSVTAERYSQETQHLNACSWDLTWLQAALKQTHKDDQTQNEHTD